MNPVIAWTPSIVLMLLSLFVAGSWGYHSADRAKRPETIVLLTTAILLALAALKVRP